MTAILPTPRSEHDRFATLAARNTSGLAHPHRMRLAGMLAVLAASNQLACGSAASDPVPTTDGAPVDTRSDDVTFDGSDSSTDSSNDTRSDSSLDTAADTSGEVSSDGGAGSCKSTGGTISCAAGKECVYADPVPKCDPPGGGEACGAIFCHKGSGIGPLCRCENAATSTCECLVVGL